MNELSEWTRGRVQNPDGSWSKSSQSKPVTVETRIKQSNKSPTKLHRDWGLRLKENLNAVVYEEAITLKLCNGVRYRPDWVSVLPLTPVITAYECKGFLRDDARKSLLFAAKEYPWIKFVLVWKEKGQWKTQEILP